MPQGALVAYQEAGDLWLYNADADESRRITNDGDQRAEWSPQFLGPGCLVYATGGPSIEVLDLSSGSRRLLLDEGGSIWSIALAPDGATLVYLHIDHNVDSTFRLKRVAMSGGEPEVVHQFHQSAGRGGSSEDEVSAAWSPDGSKLLVSNTHEFSREFENGATYVFDATSFETLAMWKGTHPRWSPDGETLYFRGFASQDAQQWFAMDLPTMDRTRVGFRPGTNNLVVSPDGRYVAYDTSSFGDIPMGVALTGKPPNIYLYDLRARQEELVLRAGIQARWIQSKTLVATNVRKGAPAPNTWGASWWTPLGTVARISVAGAIDLVDMTSTLDDAAVLIPG